MRDDLEEGIGDTIATAAKNAGANIRDKVISKTLGGFGPGERAQGRLDAAEYRKTLSQAYNRYLGQQGLRPTRDSMISFAKDVLGVDIGNVITQIIPGDGGSGQGSQNSSSNSSQNASRNASGNPSRNASGSQNASPNSQNASQSGQGGSRGPSGPQGGGGSPSTMTASQRRAQAGHNAPRVSTEQKDQLWTIVTTGANGNFRRGSASQQTIDAARQIRQRGGLRNRADFDRFVDEIRAAYGNSPGVATPQARQAAQAVIDRYASGRITLSRNNPSIIISPNGNRRRDNVDAGRNRRSGQTESIKAARNLIVESMAYPHMERADRLLMDAFTWHNADHGRACILASRLLYGDALGDILAEDVALNARQVDKILTAMARAALRDRTNFDRTMQRRAGGSLRDSGFDSREDDEDEDDAPSPSSNRSPQPGRARQSSGLHRDRSIINDIERLGGDRGQWTTLAREINAGDSETHIRDRVKNARVSQRELETMLGALIHSMADSNLFRDVNLANAVQRLGGRRDEWEMLVREIASSDDAVRIRNRIRNRNSDQGQLEAVLSALIHRKIG